MKKIKRELNIWEVILIAIYVILMSLVYSAPTSGYMIILLAITIGVSFLIVYFMKLHLASGKLKEIVFEDLEGFEEETRGKVDEIFNTLNDIKDNEEVDIEIKKSENGEVKFEVKNGTPLGVIICLVSALKAMADRHGVDDEILDFFLHNVSNVDEPEAKGGDDL